MGLDNLMRKSFDSVLVAFEGCPKALDSVEKRAGLVVEAEAGSSLLAERESFLVGG